MPAALIYCPMCDSWLRRPQVAYDAIVYCTTCKTALEGPPTWPDLMPLTQGQDEDLGVSILNAEEDAGVVRAPTALPDAAAMGRLLEVHRTAHPWKIGAAAVISLAALAVAIVLLSYGIIGRFACYGALFGLASPVFIGLFFWTLFSPQVLLLCQKGMMRIRHRRVHLFPWDQSVFFDGLTTDHVVVPGHVRNNEGAKATFDDLDDSSQKRLEECARQEIWQRQFPIAQKIFDEGGVVEYGFFGVSKEGLARNGKILPWSEISRIKILSDGRFVVRKSGAIFPWFEKKVNKIANFFVLRTLIERCAPIDHGMA